MAPEKLHEVTGSQSPDLPGKNPGHNTAGSTERLLYSMILILQDLTSPPLGTLHLPIQSAKKKKKKKKNHGSFSHLLSLFPPSFNSAVGRGKEGEE